MSDSIKPRSAHDAARQVAATLRQAGHVALFAGGCVRDLLMGRQPADYDVATDAAPARVTALFRRTLQVGAQFGVVIVLVGRANFHVEVATFRSEAGYADGRHPTDVEFSDAPTDASRRDFTINGMFLDPATAEVIDYVGGKADLAARRIRAIGVADDRFAEDHLRMLRAVRFAAVLDFQIDPATEQAILRHAPLIVDVSAERIWQEWEKVLAHPNRATGWRLADRTGLVRAIWPDLANHSAGIAARLARLSPSADATVGLACQFLPLGTKGDIARFSDNEPSHALSSGQEKRATEKRAMSPFSTVHDRCRQLALDNHCRLNVAWLIEHANNLLAAPLDIVALKKLMADENWPRLVELAKAQVEEEGDMTRFSRPDDGALLGLTDEKRVMSPFSALAANLAAAARIDPATVAPPPLIDGHDIMSLGQAEGPRVGQVLARVYDAQLADAIRTRDEALALAGELLRTLGSG